jgi:hypothetical protein
MDQERLKVRLRAGATSDEVRAVEEVFRRSGIEADVQPGIAGGFPVWEALISVAPSAFLSGYLGAAGADAWKVTKDKLNRLRQLVHNLLAIRKDPNGYVSLKDDEYRTWLSLDRDMPEEAYRQLEEIDWKLMERGHLWWSNEFQCWLYREKGARLSRLITKPHPE